MHCHGVGNLRALLSEQPKGPAEGFKDDEPGYVHVNVKFLPQMQDESKRSHLFAAIDRPPVGCSCRSSAARVQSIPRRF